jgi:hypothetical protein
MANPNLLELTSITGQLAKETVSTSGPILCTAPSNGIIKVVSLYIANTSAATHSFNVYVFNPLVGTSYMARNLDLPPETSIQVISKDAPVYLPEGQSLRLFASANSVIDAVCSFEVMS